MNKYFLLLLVCALNLRFSFAQRLDPFILNEVLCNYYKNCKSYSKSIVYAKKLISLKKQIANRYVNLMEIELLNGDTSSAFKSLNKGINYGLSHQFYQREFYNFKGTKYYDKLIKIDQKNQKSKSSKFYKKYADQKSIKLVEVLFERDQLARSFYLLFEEKDSMYLNKTINYTDSINMDELINHIKLNGFINTNEIISEGHLEIVLLHLLRYKNSFLDSTIKVNCKLRNLSPSLYTFYKDQEEYNNNISVYGTNVYGNTAMPIKNISEVDKLREEIGYPSLYEESLMFNLKLPENYKANNLIIKQYQKILSK